MIALLLFLAADGCATVNGGRITAADLATRTGAFAAVDPGLSLGHAPDAGWIRRFSKSQVAELARRSGGDPALASDVCVMSGTQPLSVEAVEAAIRPAALVMGADVRVEILGIPRLNVVAGALQFDRRGIGTPAPDGSRVWRGRLLTLSGRSQVLAIRVRIERTAAVAVATRHVKRGEPLLPDQMRFETRTFDPVEFPNPVVHTTVPAASTARRPVPAGAIIDAAAIEEAPVVRRGETIGVAARHGSTELRVEAKAETSGRVGDSVWLRAPFGRRRLSARVVAAGRAEVEEAK